MFSSHIVSWRVAFVTLLLSVCLARPAARAQEEPKPAELTEEQREGLVFVFDLLLAKALGLDKQGKTADAVVAARNLVQIQRQLYGDGEGTEILWEWIAERQERLEQFDAAQASRAEVLRIKRQLFGAKHWQVTDARLALENVAALSKLTPQQRQRLQEASQLIAQVADLSAKGKSAQAVPLAENAVVIRGNLLGEEHADVATAISWLGLVCVNAGDFAKAEALNRQSLEIRKKVLGNEHPSTATSLNNLAELYSAMGEYAKAELLYQQSLEIHQKVVGNEHPSTATSLSNLAALYQSMGDYAKAEPLYRQCLDIDKKVLGDNHPNTATSLNALGELYRSIRDYTKAEPLLRQSLEIRKKMLGEEHPDIAESLNNLALLYQSTGRYRKAEPLYQRCLEISRHNLELASAIQSQRQQLAMTQAVRFQLDNYLTLAVRSGQNGESAYRQVVAWKGMVLLRQRAMRALVHDPQLRKDFAELDGACDSAIRQYGVSNADSAATGNLAEAD